MGQSSRRALAIASVVVLGACFPAREALAAEPPAATVAPVARPSILVLLPTIAPAGIAVEPLIRSLELYARDYRPLLQRVHLSGPPPEHRTQAIAWGRARGARFVAYTAFDASTSGAAVLSLFVVDVERPERTNEGATVAYPAEPDAGALRSVGLRFRSLLQAAALQAEAPDPRAPAHAPSPPATPRTDAAARAFAWLVEVEGLASLALARPIAPGVGAAAFVKVGPAALGLEGRHVFAYRASTEAGEGSVSSQTLEVAGRVRIGPEARVAPVLGLGLGLRRVAVEATPRGGETRRTSDYVPVAKVTAMLRIALLPRLHLLAGPYVLGAPTIVRASAQGAEIIASEHLELGAHGKIQLEL